MDYRLLFTQSALADLAEFISHNAEDDGKAHVRGRNSPDMSFRRSLVLNTM